MKKKSQYVLVPVSYTEYEGHWQINELPVWGPYKTLKTANRIAGMMQQYPEDYGILSGMYSDEVRVWIHELELAPRRKRRPLILKA